MSLVGKVGRGRLRARVAMGVVYGLLTLGALTTVYPFLFMASTGFKGPTDQNDNRLVPAFWSDPGELLKKYVDDKYAGDANVIASNAQGGASSPAELGAYRRFLASLPSDAWKAGFRVPPNGVTSRLARQWQAYLRRRYGDIDALNKAYVDLNQAFEQVPVPYEGWERKTWKPPPGAKWQDWAAFKATLPPEFRIPVSATWMFQEFLRAKFKNRIEDVPPDVRGGARSFGTLALPRGGPLLEEFRAKALPDRFLGATVEDQWRVALEAAHLPQGQGTTMPVAALDRDTADRESASLRSEFTWRNYLYVLDYVALHGRALWNTVLFCLLAVLTQLTINPLAAYALSRFPMRATARILLFLLATMAFPAEVAMIPSFLLLKDLGLLNTFAALVLPSAASGYTIYLLKGFFDSLPQEVFDSGQVDGAPEWLMMLRLALPLSKPVLGYIALLAFMGAYGAFIYAFLVCQDSRMWTLMVFVYQLQVTSPKAVVMAAVTWAAVPTLVVFLACQRVIMRGIVLPGER